MSTQEEKENAIKAALEKGLAKYGDNDTAKQAVIDAVRSKIGFVTAEGRAIDIDKPENGMSIQELVDGAIGQVDKLMAPPKPKEEPKTASPAPIDKKDDAPKDDRVLPSGARVPDEINPKEVTQIDVTNPVTLETVEKIVKARSALKLAQQTSKQQSTTAKALEGIIAEINRSKED